MWLGCTKENWLGWGLSWVKVKVHVVSLHGSPGCAYGRVLLSVAWVGFQLLAAFEGLVCDGVWSLSVRQ